MIFFVVPIFGKCSKLIEISEKIRNILPGGDFIILFVDDNPQSRKEEYKFRKEKGEYKSNIGECNFFIKSGGVGQHKAIVHGIVYIIQNFWELISLGSHKGSPKLEDSIFIVMDGDLSYDVNYIPIFLDKLRNSDLVLGISDKDYGHLRKILTSLFYYLVYFIIRTFLYFHKGKLNSIPDWIFEHQILSRLTTFVAFKSKIFTPEPDIKNFLVYLIFSAIRERVNIELVYLKKNFQRCSSYDFIKLFKLSQDTIIQIIKSLWRLRKN
jgi:hypothetical protein